MIVCSVILLIPPTGASCVHLAETCAQWALAVERARAAVLARPGCRCPRSCAFGSSSQPLHTALSSNSLTRGVGAWVDAATPPPPPPTSNPPPTMAQTMASQMVMARLSAKVQMQVGYVQTLRSATATASCSLRAEGSKSNPHLRGDRGMGLAAGQVAAHHLRWPAPPLSAQAASKPSAAASAAVSSALTKLTAWLLSSRSPLMCFTPGPGVPVILSRMLSYPLCQHQPT